jgi:fatty-acyl-CoA synthase
MGFVDRLRADLTCLKCALRTLRLTTPIGRNPTRVFPAVVEELAEKFADRPALISERETFTYRELGERSNRYARWARAHGLAKGDTVCLIMPNRPEFLAIWLGITRAGGVVALINTNLTGQSLCHCINIVAPKHVIVAAEFLHAVTTISGQITAGAKLWLHGEAASDLPRIDKDVMTRAGGKLAADERCALTIEDRALYIYTSGTTGLPKPANINHYRLMLASHGFAGIMNTQPDDISYDCLPMYHTVGGVLAPGAILLVGGALVIREKFSAREFWDDIARWNCTIFHYIGELCRYLGNTPPHPKEASHKLRLACGNGLRPDVWHEFKTRFRIPEIIEFYAATEGNVQLFNFDGKEGAVGRVPWFLQHRFPVKVVKFDVEKEQPVRNAQGLCIECELGETGEMIGHILKDPSKPGARFEGYATEAETEKKIMRDVFAKGDMWFRTGDLMRKEAGGYFYFVDRIGDTFRWKGENVSTSEVSEAITVFPGVAEANVYGVTIPGRDGRAGMAALVVDEAFDVQKFRTYLAKQLPDYARPLFLRILGEIEITATFKQKKMNLVKQGFDPSQTRDAIYFNNPESGAFERVDQALHERITAGKVRV